MALCSKRGQPGRGRGRPIRESMAENVVTDQEPESPLSTAVNNAETTGNGSEGRFRHIECSQNKSEK
jgi:hypothetical protein